MDPAWLLKSLADRMTHSISATLPERSATYDASDYLRIYEAEHKVTFVALDNAALMEVRRTFEGYTDRTDLLSTLGSCEAFIAAVTALLGLKVED